MALDDLLATLERRNSVTPVTPATPAGVQPKPLQHKACTLVTPVTPENTNSGSNALQVGADTTAEFDQELLMNAPGFFNSMRGSVAKRPNAGHFWR
jgi:hypothetical protein